MIPYDTKSLILMNKFNKITTSINKKIFSDRFLRFIPKINLIPTIKKKAENIYNGTPKKIKKRFPIKKILLIIRLLL